MLKNKNMNSQLISETRRILSAQELIPRSPGIEVSPRRFALCLGAALVDAANCIMGIGAEERESVRTRMVAGVSPHSILEEASRVNIDLDFCESAIVHNDSLIDRDRRSGVFEWLASENPS